VGLASTALASDGDWITNYEEALKEAKQSNRAILADFTGSDWCGWCMKLKKEVFDTEEFKGWAAKNVVLLELDFPKQLEQSEEIKKQNQSLKEKFGIKGFPTIVFIDAKCR
jgi:protein disulfide-isomerase